VGGVRGSSLSWPRRRGWAGVHGRIGDAVSVELDDDRPLAQPVTATVYKPSVPVGSSTMQPKGCPGNAKRLLETRDSSLKVSVYTRVGALVGLADP